MTACWGSAAQAFRHRDEELVAQVVAHAVVDDLEAVDVQEEHAEQDVGPGLSGERLVELVGEIGAVRQLGQCVMGRLVNEPLLRAGVGAQGTEHAANIAVELIEDTTIEQDALVDQRAVTVGDASGSGCRCRR